MEHKLPELPYGKDALAPHISAETVEYHYRKHHKAYVDNLKRQCGCSVCGYKTDTLFRFLENDHLDPENKIANIAGMVKDNNCTLEQLIEELKKCRIICRHCHKIHTHKQLEVFNYVIPQFDDNFQLVSWNSLT